MNTSEYNIDRIVGQNCMECTETFRDVMGYATPKNNAKLKNILKSRSCDSFVTNPIVGEQNITFSDICSPISESKINPKLRKQNSLNQIVFINTDKNKETENTMKVSVKNMINTNKSGELKELNVKNNIIDVLEKFHIDDRLSTAYSNTERKKVVDSGTNDQQEYVCNSDLPHETNTFNDMFKFNNNGIEISFCNVEKPSTKTTETYRNSLESRCELPESPMCEFSSLNYSSQTPQSLEENASHLRTSNSQNTEDTNHTGNNVCNSNEVNESNKILVDKINSTSSNNCVMNEEVKVDSGNKTDKDTKKFRRSSSLKIRKLSDDNSAQKKIVRFADVMGLDLADVRTFMDDVLPFVPKMAYSDLENNESASVASPSQCTKLPTELHFLVPMFQQPNEKKDFFDKIRDNCVCLAKAVVSGSHVSLINGFVHVRNLDFHKSVYIRYTIDNWYTYSEIQAQYVPNSCDGFSDQFCFTIYLYHLDLGQRLELAIRYHCSGSLYWDNNDGVNYIFQCLSSPMIKQDNYPEYGNLSRDINIPASFY